MNRTGNTWDSAESPVLAEIQAMFSQLGHFPYPALKAVMDDTRFVEDGRSVPRSPYWDFRLDMNGGGCIRISFPFVTNGTILVAKTALVTQGQLDEALHEVLAAFRGHAQAILQGT